MTSGAPDDKRAAGTEAVVQRKADGTGGAAAAPAAVRDAIATPGESMDAGTRGFMESRFGFDFSNIRIHADSRAAESARAISAHAYTIGEDIVFARGRYDPSSEAGRHLLAHELTHRVQQRSGAGGNVVRRVADKSSPPSGLPCTIDTGPGAPGGTHIIFAQGAQALAPLEAELIAAEVRAWNARGGVDRFTVEGFSSSEGGAGINWTLSCDRAEVVKAELVRLGVPAGSVSTVAHGETEEFSADLPPNRRAVIRVVPAQAPAAAATCPTTVAENTTLEADCSAGITIGADNVVLDCAGHTITGAGTGRGILARDRTGIRVVNCRVTNFQEGFALRNVSASAFSNNRSFSNAVDGFDINDSNNNVFIQNECANNADHGFELDGSSENLFIGNTVTGNVDGFDTEGPPRDGPPAPRNTFVNNVAEANRGSGFRILSNDNTIRQNRSDQNVESGYRIQGDNNTLASNAAGANQRHGFRIQGDGNTLSDNTAGNNAPDGFHIEGNSNTLSNNTGSGSRGQDLDVDNASTGNSCAGNTFGTTNGQCPTDFP